MLSVVVDKGVENLKLSLEAIDVDATEAPNNKKQRKLQPYDIIKPQYFIGGQPVLSSPTAN